MAAGNGNGNGRKLTEKQRRFVAEYLRDFNATRAAIDAGYSARTARQQASRLLTNVDISSEVKERAEALLQRAELSAADVLEGLRRIAFADVRDAVEWGPGGVTMKDSSEIDENIGFAVAEVSETITKDGGSQRIKFHSKVDALNLLGRYFALFVERVQHENLPAILEEPLDVAAARRLLKRQTGNAIPQRMAQPPILN